MSAHPTHEVVTTTEDFGARVTRRYCLTCSTHAPAALEKPCPGKANP